LKSVSTVCQVVVPRAGLADELASTAETTTRQSLKLAKMLLNRMPHRIMKTLPGIPLLAWLLGCAVVGSSPAPAQLPVSSDLVADAVETPAGPQFSIVFSDAGTGATDYLLERTPEVGGSASWTVDNAGAQQNVCAIAGCSLNL
jgi:hypothetical protein